MKKVTLFCAAALFSLLSFAQNDKGDIVKTGDKMPAFTLTSTVNGTVNSADLKGKVVLINIFATWCGPCQSELAEVQKTLWPKYKDNKDFRMIVIGREHTDEELTAYNKRKEFTFPLYPDPKREVTNKFASQYIPRSYLINKEGKVISATVGYQKEEMTKSFVSDDEIGVVGTINLDYRSLYLHFEDGVWIYRNRVIQDIKDDFIQTMEYCRQIEPEFCLNRNIGLRIMQNIFRAFAPLM